MDETEGKPFTIRCRDGDVQVTKEQAKEMFLHCAFFRNAFRHGTIECDRGSINKPDWSFRVGERIVQLLSGDDLEVPVGPCSHELFRAIDQIQPTMRFQGGD